MARMIVVPEEFARDTVARDGERGEEWIAALPGIVGTLLERWTASLDGPVMHGDVGLIVPVRDAAGRAAVLKVSPVHPGNAHEADAFEAWAGNGAVRIFDRGRALRAAARTGEYRDTGLSGRSGRDGPGGRDAQRAAGGPRPRAPAAAAGAGWRLG